MHNIEGHGEQMVDVTKVCELIGHTSAHHDVINTCLAIFFNLFFSLKSRLE